MCGLDSDGDGKSNGQELGDPDCKWKFGDDHPSSNNLSHPGISLSLSSLSLSFSLSLFLTHSFFSSFFLFSIHRLCHLCVRLFFITLVGLTINLFEFESCLLDLVGICEPISCRKCQTKTFSSGSDFEDQAAWLKRACNIQGSTSGSSSPECSVLDKEPGSSTVTATSTPTALPFNCPPVDKESGKILMLR